MRRGASIFRTAYRLEAGDARPDEIRIALSRDEANSFAGPSLWLAPLRTMSHPNPPSS